MAEEANFDWSGKITGKICLKSEKEKELSHQHSIIQRVTYIPQRLICYFVSCFFLQLLYYGILVCILTNTKLNSNDIHFFFKSNHLFNENNKFRRMLVIKKIDQKKVKKKLTTKIHFSQKPKTFQIFEVGVHCLVQID